VLKIEADQRFFERRLDGVDVVIHGRNFQERYCGTRVVRHSVRRLLYCTRPNVALASWEVQMCSRCSLDRYDVFFTPPAWKA
jgi:hypothetical protein